MRAIECVLDVPRAVGIIGAKRVLPVLAAVGRSVYPASFMGAVALCRNDDDIWIFRIDNDLVDLCRLLQADMNERPAGVRRLIHAVPRWTLNGVARADIYDVRI